VMRRIYYSSNFFRPTNISCFRYLRILSFSYYSVIKVQIHCLTSERCHRNFQEHRSLFNIILLLRCRASSRHKTTRHTPPGRIKNPFICGALLIFMSACYSTNLLLLQNLLTTNSVEMAGFEPATFALQRRCSPTELHPQDLLGRVGLTGLEPVTPALSAQCSNQLSYKPAVSYL